MSPQPECLFFGVYDPREKGHFLWSPGGRARALPGFGDRGPQIPEVLWGIDGGFCPKAIGERQGRAALRFVDGWTVLAFWDRSGDSRGASNSNFLAPGRHSFAAMVALAKAAHPTVWARFPFAVALEGPDLEPAPGSPSSPSTRPTSPVSTPPRPERPTRSPTAKRSPSRASGTNPGIGRPAAPEKPMPLVPLPHHPVYPHTPAAIEAAASHAFARYNDHAGGKTYDGKHIPPWAECGEPVRSHWRVAVVAAFQVLLPALESPVGPCSKLGCGHPARWSVRHGQSPDDLSAACDAHLAETVVAFGGRAEVYPLEAARPPAPKRPRCSGYPTCDGDLEGEPHEPPCPLAVAPPGPAPDVRLELPHSAEKPASPSLEERARRFLAGWAGRDRMQMDRADLVAFAEDVLRSQQAGAVGTPVNPESPE